MPEKEKNLDVNAKSVEEAVEQGLAQLGLTKDQVDIEILSEGKRGLFGLGSEEATVRLTPKGQSQPDDETPPSSAETPAPETPAADENDEADEVTDSHIEPDEAEAAPAPESDDKTVEKIGVDYLSELLQHMGVEATVETRYATDLAEPDEDPPLVFDVIGQDLGILIGRRNETLQALQYMVRLMVSKEMGSWQPIIIDVESYRARRRASLRKLAKRMADKAVKSNQRVVLEAMPAYERRIIHIVLRDHPDVITKSIGRDNNRKITIIPK